MVEAEDMDTFHVEPLSIKSVGFNDKEG